MTQDRVMLLIDADNVSADVIEQAVVLLLAEHGALHVRRAYCTAESAVQNQALFKRLQIKPMVNLAAGKNSTDIALAVDAIDLVLAERPEVVVIASSDSDFAPLVNRLREKGCRVIGIGQDGKTGEETKAVYDDYTVLAHHKARSTARATGPAPAPRAPAKKAVRRKAAAPASASASAAAAASTPAATRAAAAARSSAPAGALAPEAETAPPAPTPPSPPIASGAGAGAESTGRGRRSARGNRAERSASASPEPDKVQQILQALPELSRGELVELQVAGERLRKAHLLSRSGSSKKLLSQFADRFELVPPGLPTRVRLR